MIHHNRFFLKHTSSHSWNEAGMKGRWMNQQYLSYHTQQCYRKSRKKEDKIMIIKSLILLVIHCAVYALHLFICTQVDQFFFFINVSWKALKHYHIICKFVIYLESNNDEKIRWLVNRDEKLTPSFSFPKFGERL